MAEGTFFCPVCNIRNYEDFCEMDGQKEVECPNCNSDILISEWCMEVDIHTVEIVNKRNCHEDES